MDWLKKLGEYAPDIVGAILSGGATLPATALKILGKELLGSDDASEADIETAVKNATPEQMTALTKVNNNFKVEMLKLQNEEAESARSAEVNEMANARKSYGKHNEQADKIADNVMKFNILYAVLIALAQIAALTFAKDMSDAVIVVIGNVCGWIIKGVLDERKDVTGFYFGSSIGSKAKDK
jgi:Iap family predicted aminopeptidase